MTGKTTSINEMFQRAAGLHQQGALEDALALYKQILDSQPDHPDVINLAGLAAYQMEDNDRAVMLMRRAEKVTPDNPGTQNNLGLVLQATGDMDGAISAFQKAVDLKPDFAGGWANLGIALNEAKRFSDAVEALNNAREAMPDDPSLINELGIALQQTGAYGEAELMFRQLTRMDPRSAEAHANLGLAQRSLKKYEEAEQSYRKAIALDPDFDRAYNALGQVFLDAEKPDKAAAIWDQWLRRDPGNSTALAFKAIALNECGEKEEVEKLYDFDRLVLSKTFDAPKGYDDISEFNRDLVAHVLEHPNLKTETEEHATTHGRITDNLEDDEGPIRTIKEMITQAVADYMEMAPLDADHPFLSQRPDNWRYTVWSVVLEKEGHQRSHNHGEGWLSGCYYAKIPEDMSGPGHEHDGWIEFGYPPSEFPCKAEAVARAYQPKEGLMLLFPAYFYHRTVPYHCDEQRVCVAFDVVPVDEETA